MKDWLLKYRDFIAEWLRDLQKARVITPRFIMAVCICLAAVTLLVVVLIYRHSSNDSNMYVYYFNPIELSLEAVSRPIPERDKLNEAIEFLHSGPGFGPLVSTWPRELAPLPEDLVSNIFLEDDILIAFFSPVFYEMTPLDQSLFKASFVHTMESLPYVYEITIVVTDDYRYVYDKIMHNLSAEGDNYEYFIYGLLYDGDTGIYNDPLISPVPVVERTFTHLYFVNSAGTGLVKGEHDDEFESQSEQLAIQVLDLLISLAEEEDIDVLPVIPAETTVRDLEINRTRIPMIVDDGNETEENITITTEEIINVHVDLSSDFMTRFTYDTAIAELMIYSIVNTLTEVVLDDPLTPLNSIIHVFFLIDTQPVENFHGITDFHMYFTRNPYLLLSNQLVSIHGPTVAGAYE